MKTLALTALVLLTVSLPIWTIQNQESVGPILRPEHLTRALESDRPSRLPGSDELDFYYGRRQSRNGDDDLADRRILSGHQGRYQGYGLPEDLASAEALADSLLSARPGDPAVWAAKAHIDLSRHQFRRAKAAAKRAIRLAPPIDGDVYRLRLFDTYLASGHYDQAERILALPLDRDAFPYIVRQARLADRKGDVEGARDLMAHALELAEAYAQPRLVRAWNLVELGHFEHHGGDAQRGVARYLEALEVAPGYPAALEGLGWIAFGVDENPDAARALFTKSLENGGHPDLRLTLAEVARFQGRPGVASEQLAWLEEASARDPEMRRLLARPLALALAEAGALEKALLLSKEDLSDRRTAESLAVHGWITHRMGRFDAARDLFDQALAWGQPEPMVHYLAGKAAAQRGDHVPARRLLNAALGAKAELGPRVAQELARLRASL